MPETSDPVAALSAKDIPTRAAATRDLSAAGTPAHLPLLVKKAIEDDSPGVRLGAAAAAADVLSRHRLAPDDAAIPPEVREAMLRTVAGADPGRNVGLFQVCGALGIPGGFARIVVGLRDPRFDVRAGACVGLWRHCASAAANGDVDLERSVVALFAEGRIPADTKSELARVCANVGYTSALDAIRALAEGSARQVRTVAEEAQKRLEWPPGVEGVWVDLGLDAGEVDPAAVPRGYAGLLDASAVVWAGDGKVRREPLPRAPRRLWMKRPGGESAGAVLQIGARTLWPADGDDLGAFGDALLAAKAWDLLDAVDVILPATAAGVRVRGVAKLERGDVAGALEALAACVEMKKVPPDAWWWLAEALHRAGRDEEAKPHLEKFLAKSPKKAPHVAEAKKRLGV
ncbi:MAG: tetratricopeptide repeat protein [Myxococcota bacterium]